MVALRMEMTVFKVMCQLILGPCDIFFFHLSISLFVKDVFSEYRILIDRFWHLKLSQILFHCLSFIYFIHPFFSPFFISSLSLSFCLYHLAQDIFIFL